MSDASHSGPKLSNFRDFGGVALAGGGRIVAGRLFRSAAPGALTADDVELLGRHGVTTIIDLRGAKERLMTPTPDVPGVAIVSTPIEPNTTGDIRALLASGQATADAFRDIMLAAYRSFVTREAAALGAAMVAMVEAEGPALVHCTAGKDRTGVFAAVLQTALGAPRATVMADYLQTNRDWDRASLVGHLPIDADVMQPILMADEAYLDAAFEEIARHFGDAHGFIRHATGERVTPDQLERLIDKGDLA